MRTIRGVRMLPTYTYLAATTNNLISAIPAG